MFENEIKIVITQNKYGYLNVDLCVGSKKIFLTKSLSKFEIVWLANRRERLLVDVVGKEFKGQLYDIVVVRDIEGYDDEYVTLKLDSFAKQYIISIIKSRDIG